MRKNGLSGRACGVEIEASCELIFWVTAVVHRRPASSRLFLGLVWLASTPFGRKMAFLEWYRVFLELQKISFQEPELTVLLIASLDRKPDRTRKERKAPFALVRRWEISQRGQQADGLALHATELENAAVTSMRACTGDCDGVGLGFALFFFGFAVFLLELFCLLVSGRKMCTGHSMRNVFRNRAYYWLLGGSSTVATASSVWLHALEAMTESSSGTVWSNDAWSHPWLPHSPNSTTSPPHPVPFRSSCEGGYNRQIRVEHLHRARTPNFRPANRGTTFADFGFGAGPLLTRRRAKKNLDWGFLVPPTPSACWDNPPFLFGMDYISGTWGSDHGEDLMHGGSPQRGLFFPLAPAGRPGTALCDVVPGSSVLAGEDGMMLESGNLHF
ncbi:hypothetical protein BDZ91DRAFT_763822 [Kalaharituber pfeilii]|nr:hypothetical protein BDZ91DRAFT_763822 [Kalaharituber pfeilii]